MHVVSVETRPDALFERRIFEKVARELFDGELVEMFILIESLDHPFAPFPHITMIVDVITVRVGIAREVEPLCGHAFAELRRSEQALDQLLVRFGSVVSEEG